MRIFLGNSPWQNNNRYGVRAGSRWPHWQAPGSIYLPFPFYLAYATAILEKDGFECKLIDGIAEHITDGEFIQRGAKFDPDIIVLETSTPTIEIDIQTAIKLRRACPRNVKIVFTGPHISVFQDKFLLETPVVDYLCIGEYDYTLRELVRTLNEHRAVDNIKGIVYRNSAGNIIINPRRESITNLDELPWPAYHHLPMLKYNDDFNVLPKPMVQMWASRGCPFKCNFCLWPQVIYANHQYRTRDPVKVVDEMEWLINTYGFKSVYFDDDTFDIGKRRILALCSEIKKRGIKIHWAAMARADTLDREILHAMADSGMIAIKYGVESGVQEIVNGCNKHLDLKKVIKTVEITKAVGIKVHLTFTFGLAGETKNTIQKTIDFALELDPDSVQFSIITPFPGTKYYAELKEQGYLLANSWSDFDGNRSAVIRTEHLTTEDLEKALQQAYSVWYEHRDKKIAIREAMNKSMPVIENLNGNRNFKKILILNYADTATACRTAKILRDKYPPCHITLMNSMGTTAQQLYPNLFSEIFIIPYLQGWAKIKTAADLLKNIRMQKYDMVIMLNEDASSYMRRFPLSLTYLSGASNKIIADIRGNGYLIENSISHFSKLISHWLAKK